MTHISSIGAAIFTDLAVSTGVVASNASANTNHVRGLAIVAGGTTGTPGTQTITGTTGTGTKFTASVTVSAGGVMTAILAILTPGYYTVDPTNVAVEPVTGGALVGATVALTMGYSGTELPNTLDMTAGTGFPTLFQSETTSDIGGFRRATNNREFPAIGTPPNIVKVPGYQHKLSQQVQGQADAPNLEITINYVASDWATGASGTVLGNMVGDGIQRVWRFTVLNMDSAGATAATKYASTVAGVGTVQNTQYFWLGKLESLQVKPSLSEASTAVLVVSMQSDFYGAFTI